MRIPPLARPRTVWLPTLLGWALLGTLLVAPLALWFRWGETWLSADQPVQPDVLLIDGWIKEEPIAAASRLFAEQHFRQVVATGTFEGERWQAKRWNLALDAQRLLRRNGVPDEKIVLAQAPDVVAHRTHAALVAAKEALAQSGRTPCAVTVYTRGMHARRSALVARKVFGPDIPVGVISWRPPGTEATPWWKESSRAEDFLKETVGLLWEWLADSGR